MEFYIVRPLSLSFLCLLSVSNPVSSFCSDTQRSNGHSCHNRFSRDFGIRRSLLISDSASVNRSAKEADAACVSIFPSMCHFVNPLPIPRRIDATTGETLTIGYFVINHTLHRDLAPALMYGIGENAALATVPGPTLVARRGVKTQVQWENHIATNLYNHRGYTPISAEPTDGNVPVVMHLHGGETEPQSDGHPDAWWTCTGEKGPTYVKSTFTYENAQYPATLWYHDHTSGHTYAGKTMGLTGMYILTDPEGQEASFTLPSGEYDLPIMMMDRISWPYHESKKAKYRLRILNGFSVSPVNLTFVYVDDSVPTLERGLNFSIPNGTILDMYVVATDSGYIERPQKVQSLFITAGERYEVVVDFNLEGSVAGPAEVYLVNLYGSDLDEYGFPTNTDLGTIMKFYVADEVVESPRLPTYMAPYLKPNESMATVERWIPLLESELVSLVHRNTLAGRHWPEAATEIVNQGTTEMWHFVNESPQLHTIHLHAVRVRIVARQTYDVQSYHNGSCSFKDFGKPDCGEPDKPTCFTRERREPEPTEMGWKDTVAIGLSEVLTLLFSTTDQDGNAFAFDPSQDPHYVWHCHINRHQDFEMIRPFLIVPPTETPHAIPSDADS
eukprot:TRINITY_DN19349_c0_g1_i1.p1 TRINITY_DN19349_c0_g1~~TRINITY_DN19349_c0_g1_i1.p1  ORF type:complete len:654 (-),score=69.09 TRINITY_DN19349_c0_g1_i1:790-2631(-)